MSMKWTRLNHKQHIFSLLPHVNNHKGQNGLFIFRSFTIITTCVKVCSIIHVITNIFASSPWTERWIRPFGFLQWNVNYKNWERKGGVAVEKRSLIDSGAAAGCDAGAGLVGRAGYGGSCDAAAIGSGAAVSLCSGTGVCSVHETWSGSGNDPSLYLAPPSLWCRTFLPVPQTYYSEIQTATNHWFVTCRTRTFHISF